MFTSTHKHTQYFSANFRLKIWPFPTNEMMQKLLVFFLSFFLEDVFSMRFSDSGSLQFWNFFPINTNEAMCKWRMETEKDRRRLIMLPFKLNMQAFIFSTFNQQ